MKDVNINGKENPQKVSAFTLQKKSMLKILEPKVKSRVSVGEERKIC